MHFERVESGWKRGRFAPSTTGRVHPGTLISGLLCWLDARATGSEVLLRLEDLDQQRTKPGYVEQMQRDLEWFGLDWDARELQSETTERHDAALESLIADGRIFACDCSRRKLKETSPRSPDGGRRYAGTCRDQIVSSSNWRELDRSMRLRLESSEIRLMDESGFDLSGNAAQLYGDPIVRRRDGVYAYHFASVVDDANTGVDRVVRGRDLAPSTSLQAALQQVMGFATPAYRHHLLFMEGSGEKLSKFHGAVDLDALRQAQGADELCGQLAAFVGLVPVGTRCRPLDLVSVFDWARIRSADLSLVWDVDGGLRLAPIDAP
jgi:glutamyl-tRNA synthetase/glutamyl-Q tRNA(Asp) synthetase